MWQNQKPFIKQELENIATQKAIQAKNQEKIARISTTVATDAGTAASVAGTGASALHTAAMKAQALAAGVAKGALVGLAMAGVVVLVEWISKAIEHQQDMTKATDGLRRASAEAISPIREQAVAVGTVALASTNASAALKTALESQLKLVDSINERNSETSASQATWQRYGDIIKEYTNQTNLSEPAQAKLKDAISKLNAEMGTQYTVTDAVNGKIIDEKGNVLDTTDAIDKLIQKKIEQIRIDALLVDMKDAYKSKRDSAVALCSSTKRIQRHNEGLCGFRGQFQYRGRKSKTKP